MIDVLDKYECELIVLVGYMRFVSAMFIEHFRKKKGIDAVMNIHPALLPSFKGMHAHNDALEYGVKVSGVTVHFVDPKEDHGPIIIQHAVPVYDTDKKDTLGPRILEWEHKAFPKAIELFCDSKLKVDGRIEMLATPETAQFIYYQEKLQRLYKNIFLLNDKIDKCKNQYQESDKQSDDEKVKKKKETNEISREIPRTVWDQLTAPDANEQVLVLCLDRLPVYGGCGQAKRRHCQQHFIFVDPHVLKRSDMLEGFFTGNVS